MMEVLTEVVGGGSVDQDSMYASRARHHLKQFMKELEELKKRGYHIEVCGVDTEHGRAFSWDPTVSDPKLTITRTETRAL